MIQLGSDMIDMAPLWTFVVLGTRLGGVFTSLPGVGTDQIGLPFRFYAATSIAFALCIAGFKAPEAGGISDILIVLGSEFLLGYALGAMPSFILGGLGVAGQVVAGAIGLGQANMIDPSLGANVSVIARLQMMVATVAFLMIDGHHAVIRAASEVNGAFAFGLYRPGEETAKVLMHQLVTSFELALSVAGPILVTTLVTQFVLGLITKFIPQINIFIISLPLSLVVGLFLIANTFEGFIELTVGHFLQIDELYGLISPRPR